MVSAENRVERDGIKLTIISETDVLEARRVGWTIAKRAGFRGTGLDSIVAVVAVLSRILLKGAHGLLTLDLTKRTGLVGVSMAIQINPAENCERLRPALLSLLFRALEQMDGIEVTTSAKERRLVITKWQYPFAA